ncbi:predicted protein [Nematostella vectensis]|uniref:G-protein coupled receptors family 3 profile domain-containing protein n=1 Tax=Nematostella vectensis TaxID=45351 RepID=A7RQC9_NEMVE|nr:predicted protein [Nematostella vectensis]|eukprot:XP_001638403.1 predicted protein [Nematostella vectensis]
MVISFVYYFSQILASYPEPVNHLCIVRLWFRHIGFGLAYTSLLLKTWRYLSGVTVYHSLQALRFIIAFRRYGLSLPSGITFLFIMPMTLLAFPEVDLTCFDHFKSSFRMTPRYVIDWTCSKFEVMFLFWGIRLCYNVRKAPSAFNESKFISWSIYNMTVVTLFLKITSLFIINVAGPDMLYLMEFFRVQLTVTPLLGMVFVPKVTILFE